ncbi:hypothetical protein JOC75_003102 [Metabacillus crassostreae]|uniref:hypothetical protein n=1 Tax=Metabacillus crassostreae TaxID=929098 RepID=UPI00195B8EC0|nr:hypothetical protein [Metabacillus crassostreae]MBM7605098.1 hypothetical protein [Metabacillus crassostreae]
MEWSQWLQGGPFLEVSFLLELKEEKKKTIQDIINKLSRVTNKVEIVDENVDDIIDFFDSGNPYDEEDPQSIYLYSLRLKLYVYLSCKRKATLQMEMVSSNVLLVNFWFYGSEFDAPEWDQIGIKKEEFTGFLKELYSVYTFTKGLIRKESFLKRVVFK